MKSSDPRCRSRGRLGNEVSCSIYRNESKQFVDANFRACDCWGFLLFDGCALKMGKQPRQEIVPLYSTHSAEFRQAAGSLLGPNFIPGNNITTLVNGNQISPAMLGAIQSAKCSINFETYTFWDGEIARRFTEALAERAQAGVKVNAILDAQGTQKMGRQNLERLRNAGVEVVKYHSVLLARSTSL